MTAETGGVMNRLESTRVAFVARYWKAAAYDQPGERSPSEWAKAALVPLVLALVLGLVNALAYYVVGTYPAYFPDPETPAGFVLDFLPATHGALSGVLFALTVMYLGKLLVLVVEDALEEVPA